ncbi:MAG: hypothetical protein ACI4JQ_02445, partial [Ruminococcus sp.]
MSLKTESLRTVRALSDSASEAGTPFKESWLAEDKTERLKALQTSHWDVCKIVIASSLKQGGSGLVRFPLEMLSHFSPLFPARQKDGAGSFAVCGRR